MTSSILPSSNLRAEKKVPTLTMALAFVAMVGFAVGITYTLKFNPEVIFWKEISKRKLAYAESLHQQQGRIIGFAGGSSTAFGINTEMLTNEYGLPSVNLALHAGCGLEMLAGFSFSALRDGDTLIICFEPGLLKKSDISASALGRQVAFAIGRPEVVVVNDFKARDRVRNWGALRPGGYHAMTMFGKIVMGMPLYRYNLNDYREGGMLVTSERRPMPRSIKRPDLGESVDAELVNTVPSDESIRFLELLRDEAENRGVKVFYLMPWAYVSDNQAAEERIYNMQFLRVIEKILPVIHEEELGVYSNAEHFADTALHLTEAGSNLRTEILAKSLKLNMDWRKSH